MNYSLSNLPTRHAKPRTTGVTMVIDKGLSLRETEDFLEVAEAYTDIVKLGWGTSLLTPNLKEKLHIYQKANIPVYFGGTLFEAFIIRNEFDEFKRILDTFSMKYAEVSDGSIPLEHDQKCEYIHQLSKQVTVLSEVGSKDKQKTLTPSQWVMLMQAELQAGSWKVITEAREGGNTGIYDLSGQAHQDLINEIRTSIPSELIVWEAPLKDQQAFFVKLIGANVNLGNIAPSDAISAETIRLGLRGDTLNHFLKPGK